MKYGVLTSGELGFIILNSLNKNFNVVFVMTDFGSLNIIEYCKVNSIPYFIGNPRNGKSDFFLSENECDFIISINYIFLIDSKIINHPKKKSINFHGSILPKYRGRSPHVWSIINGETEIGITAHKIDEGCDSGEIIEQIKIKITKNDTGASILEKYKKMYWPFVYEVIQKLIHNNFKLLKQNHTQATYFGKRTPEDGHINWGWQKQQIRNWIRAQAYPYPGAFTFFNKNKIIIDSVRFSDFGFDYKQENGMILNIDPLVVKSSNGAIEIVTVRSNINFLKLYDVLS